MNASGHAPYLAIRAPEKGGGLLMLPLVKVRRHGSEALRGDGSNPLEPLWTIGRLEGD